jgi:hypothetical protein
MQKALEDKSINTLSAELQRIPVSMNELDDAVMAGQLVEKPDEDDDVRQYSTTCVNGAKAWLEF